MTSPRRPPQQFVQPRRRLGWAVVLVAAVSLRPGPAHADDWATPGLDGAHSRRSTERSGAAFSDGRWLFTPASHAPALASPVVSDGTVVSADLDGVVNALRADTGAPLWRASLGASIQGTPAIASGRVFVPTLGGKIEALALADGSPLWATKLGGLNVSSPAVVGGDVIVGAGLPQQVVARLDGVTGAVVWQTPPGMEQFSNTSPAVADGLVVVGTNGGHYYAFDASTGIPRWDYRADGIVNIAAPLIAGGRVFMAGGGQSDRVHAVDATTGAPIDGWPITLPSPDPDLAGTRIYRRRAISSFAAAGGLLVLETRLDDALDTDGDRVADRVLSRESVVALDARSGAVVWQRSVARVVFTDAGDVPTFVVCPTPAAFSTAGGVSVVAVASSLVGTISVLDASSGVVQGDLTTAGRALASPVLANGRLITVAENGAVEARSSTANHPPAAPVLAASPRPLDAGDATVRWAPSMDADGDQPSYELRVDTDGEVLMTYALRLLPAAGTTAVAVPGPLAPGVTYTFAVRARDASGALSPWSAPETFTVAAAGTVAVNGTPAASLRSAVAAAHAGDVIQLGAGTFPLSETLHVAAGAALKGAGAGRTTIDASGLSVGINFSGTDPKGPASLDGATVTGAATCVAVAGDATGVQLSHLVVRDCATAGVAVAAAGGADIANATVVNDGTGVDATGAVKIKNSLLTGNGVALASRAPGALASSYDDLFGNTTDYAGLTAGTGDLAAAVTFVAPDAHDFRLRGPQPSTDRGDPSDAVGAEPTPNGARVNLGAFGGTADAELSVLSPVTGNGGDPAPTPVTSTPDGPGTTPRHVAGDAGCSVARSPAGRGSSLAMFVVMSLLFLCSRRKRRRT